MLSAVFTALRERWVARVFLAKLTLARRDADQNSQVQV